MIIIQIIYLAVKTAMQFIQIRFLGFIKEIIELLSELKPDFRNVFSVCIDMFCTNVRPG